MRFVFQCVTCAPIPGWNVSANFTIASWPTLLLNTPSDVNVEAYPWESPASSVQLYFAYSCWISTRSSDVSLPPFCASTDIPLVTTATTRRTTALRVRMCVPFAHESYCNAGDFLVAYKATRDLAAWMTASISARYLSNVSSTMLSVGIVVSVNDSVCGFQRPKPASCTPVLPRPGAGWLRCWKNLPWRCTRSATSV